VKADIRQNDRNKGGIGGGGGGGEQNQLQQNNNKNSEVFTSTTSTTESPPAVDPFASPPVFSADGKTPRVKADINNQLIQSGAVVGGAVGSKLAAGAGSPPVRKQGSKKVELDRTQLNKIDFVEPGLFADGESATTTTTEPPFLGPDVKPDGRSPRVKANLLANKKQQPASNNNKVVEEEEEQDNRKKKLPVPPFIPTSRPGAAFSSRAKTTLNPFFIDQEEPSTSPPQQGDDLFVQSQPEQEDGEDEENIALFSSTFSPPTALPTFSTATGRGFDPFNLGPPPQPKIPTSVLSRLPPPANRRPPPVAIFTTPAPFTTAPPPPLLEPQSPPSEGIGGDDEDPQLGSFGPNAVSGGGRVKPARGQKTPRVKANELAKLNNQATRFRTSEPQKIFSEESSGRNQQQPGGNRAAPPPERVRNQQVASGATGRPAQNSIFSADDGPEEPTVNDGHDDGVHDNDGENAISTDEEGDRQLFSATPLPLQEPPTMGRPRQNFKFVRPSTAAADEAEANNNNKCSNPFKCPPRTFAGGRKPRVKSNIKALDRNFWHPEPRQSRVIKRRKQHVRISPVFKAEILGRRQGRRQQDRPGDGPLTNEIADDNDKELDGSLTNEISDNNELDSNGSQEEKEVSDVTSSTTPDPVASLQQLVREKEKEGRFFNSKQSLVTTAGKHKTGGVLNSNKPQQHLQQQSLGRPKPDFLNSQERLDPANSPVEEHTSNSLHSKRPDSKQKQNAK
jgi:hypothetical protein